MEGKKAIIIGGGIAGPASALALSKIGITSTIYEPREGAVTIGGAINLTHNVLRVLEKAMGCGCSCEKIEMFSVATRISLGNFIAKIHGYSSLRIL